MTGAPKMPGAAFRACARCGVVPSRHLLAVNIARQSVSWFQRQTRTAPVGRASRRTGVPRGRIERRQYQNAPVPWPPANYALIKTFRCSTSKFGIGEKAGSNKTPRGLHRIAQKIGGGWPIGSVFKGRQFVGYTWLGHPWAPITHRILWLEGLEEGFNRGNGVDSCQRYIYIHGTGNETTLGRPDSHGCVHLSADDLLPLYDKLPAGTLVWME